MQEARSAGSTPGLPMKPARYHSISPIETTAARSWEGDTSPTIPVKVWALDDLLVEYKLPVPQMVKIDAEGFDLKVLRGARTLLGETDVFLVEVAVVSPIENCVAAVVPFMAEAGYQLVDITELNRSPKYNVLWLSEFAFLRNRSPLLAQATSYE